MTDGRPPLPYSFKLRRTFHCVCQRELVVSPDVVVCGNCGRHWLQQPIPPGEVLTLEVQPTWTDQEAAAAQQAAAARAARVRSPSRRPTRGRTDRKG